jgi:outer membrane protein
MLAAFAAIGAASAPACAKAGDFIVRGRVILVAPNDSSGGVHPTFPGEEVKVDNAWAPEIDGTYMATDHIGFELIAATTKHHVSGKSGALGTIGQLASAWVLPPTLTAQYHFIPDGKVRPYVGAGVNYTIYYNENASGGLEAAVGKTTVNFSNSFGPAVQAGVDVALARKLFLNFDAKWIDMHTHATLNTAAIGKEKVNVHINPFVLGAGIGTTF